jgi:peptidoglycan hydrolase FlgJ
MISISKPVGITTEKGCNSPAEVKKIQDILNKNLYLLPGIKKLIIDGKVGKNFEKSNTITAIKEFQIKVVKMVKPDGRVDPNGNTLKKLNANARDPRPTNVSLFVNKIYADAKKINLKYQIPASILIAQAALESGWGRHVKDNAYFGIKTHNSTGASTTFTTTEVINGKKITMKDSFRAYANFSEAAEDYAKFLTTQPRYHPAFIHSKDPLKFADALQLAGYATDPSYAKKLKSIITTYYLDEYDQ